MEPTDKDDKPYTPSANAFVVMGFVFMWLVGFYPFLSSIIGMRSPAGAIALLLGLPVLMSAVMVPLSRKNE